MKFKKIIFFILFLNFTTQGEAMENPKITIKLKYGEVKLYSPKIINIKTQ